MQNYKKVVYLDQNFVSNLAKSLYDTTWKDPLAPFYRELRQLLFDLTDQNKLICPTSLFHREETELGRRVSCFLWHFVEHMGYGLSFKSSPEIMWHQIHVAAQAYCGLPATPRSEWTDAFNRDPQILVGQLSRPELSVNIPHSQEFNEYMRLSRASIADGYWTYREYCRKNRRTFADEVEAQKKQFVFDKFSPPAALNVKPSKLEWVFNLLGRADVIQFHRSVDDILKRSTNPEGFFVSPELLDCPYIHIWASLMAADIFFYPDKKRENSLFTDFQIVASVLPYVDILATDKYVTELIRQASLSDQFEVQVFSVGHGKELVEQLRRL